MNPTSARILVVDDERIVAKDLQLTLQRMGYTVPDTAGSGEEAIERCAAHQPDLVLMDILLRGELDGIQAAEQIRARSDIPVIYLSAYADRATLDRAKIAEPLGYLIKPYEERLLRATIEMALFKNQAERQLRKSEAHKGAILSASLDGLFVVDETGAILETNPALDQMFGWPPGSLVGKLISDLLMLPADREAPLPILLQLLGSPNNGASGQRLELSGRRMDSTQFSLELSLVRIGVPGPALYAGTVRDISERKEVEAARERLIAQLHDAIAQIKTLSGLLRMCAHCKKICNEAGEWMQLEHYIESHSQANVTSGFCPECAHNLYPEVFPEKG
ncbi:MAG TPA: response regulator [Verrucomicrobiae bacterium]|jgi:PAS domain S-box-containing protein